MTTTRVGGPPLDFRFLDLMLVLLVGAVAVGVLALARPSGSSPTRLKILTSALPEAIAGHPYPQRLMASGGLLPHTWKAKHGADFAISDDGVFTSIPARAGRHRLEVEVYDQAKSMASVVLELVVIETGASSPLRFATKALPPVMKGRNFAATFAAEGGAHPYSWTIDGLPEGLTATGADVTGIPGTAGIFELRVAVTDALGNRDTGVLDLQVLDNCGPPQPGVVAPLSATLMVPPLVGRRAYEVQLCASGGSPPYQWKPLSFAPGVTLSGSGRLRVENPEELPNGWSMQGKVFDAAGQVAVGAIYPRVIQVPNTFQVMIMSLAFVAACVVIVCLLRLSADTQALAQHAMHAPFVMRAATACGVLGVASVATQWVMGFWAFMVCAIALGIFFLVRKEE